MKTDNFAAWCDAAVSGILFPPDRKQVHGELLDHIHDHYDDLVGQGLDRDAARRLALEAMGDAEEIAPQLAAIHRPFWGYFLRFTRVALVLMVCVIALCLGSLLWNSSGPEADHSTFDPYADTSYSSRTRLFYAEPDISVQSDGYTLTLTRAAVWHYEYNAPSEEDGDTFYCQIEVFNPRPWAEHTYIGTRFWAVDSLGNTYDSYYGRVPNDGMPYVSSGCSQSGPLTYTQDMWIVGYRSQEAKWIEFHYDRSGRDLVWRIDLTGGDGT